MKILVCITHVPDTTSRISFKENDTIFNSTDIKYVIGPYDEYALSRAVELKGELGGTVTVLNVGGPECDPTIRKALAIGADDAIRINAEPLDAYFVSKSIAAAIKEEGYDLILMGRESIDFNGGQVHGMVAELLGLPSISPVMTLDIKDNKAIMAREIEGGKEKIEATLPLVVGCQEPIAEWKIANMRSIMGAKRKPLKIIDPEDLDNKLKVIKFELPPEKGEVKLIDPDNVGELIELLKNDAKVI